MIFKRLQWINQWAGWHFLESWSASRRATSYYQVIAIPGKHWINHDGFLFLGGGIHFGWFCLLLWRFCMATLSLLSRPSHHQAERISSVNFRPSIPSQPQHQITNSAIMIESDLKRCTMHTDCTENAFQLPKTLNAPTQQINSTSARWKTLPACYLDLAYD